MLRVAFAASAAVMALACASVTMAQPVNTGHAHNMGNGDLTASYDGEGEVTAARQYRAEAYKPPRGGEVRRWSRGDRLPPVYRSRAYAIDHAAYGLERPPISHRWVRVGDDVVLASTTNGLIKSVVRSLFEAVPSARTADHAQDGSSG